MTDKPPLQRVLIYTRDACRPQLGRSEEQLRECEAYAHDQGLTVVGHYDDHGSGLRAGDGLLALCAHLERGGIGAVVVRDASRIGRAPQPLLYALSSAAKADVRVCSAEAGELNQDTVFVGARRR